MSRSERFWDKAAHTYDQQEKKAEPTYRSIMQRTQKHLKPSDIVLEVGCGTGLMTNEMAQYVSSIHAIDLSSNMIAIAAKKAQERGITNVDYIHTTLMDERFKRGAYDVIFAFHVLHLLEDERKALRRLNEMLKPGGLLISTTPCVGEKPLLKGLLSLLGKAGLAPTIKPFKGAALARTIEEEAAFSVVESVCLKKNTREYFIIAAKKL
ncbi:class I SAM-dependent methyltransferase [Paenibacillus sp. PL2-23]|uniref:class I SAM-dependent methyltransferase n=1 Tax=Paenibacillus sp. PL2-23 TaxID=2100729 RepID=UPI0030F9D546